MSTNSSDADVFRAIEENKSIFKIVTKTKNERFFIEKWIIHHLNILHDTKLIIFDNMSDDDDVLAIYKKYRDNIILARFDAYMDSIHKTGFLPKLYRSLSISTKFFTIIDSDEYLYMHDKNKLIKDSSIVNFLDNSSDCNFFAPCWLENIENNENLLSFNPQNLRSFNFGKPIINTKMIPSSESALVKFDFVIHHTIQLPIFAYGKAPTRFLLAHLKNLDKHQRIKSNMEKLTALRVLKNKQDFSTLLKFDLDTIHSVKLNTLADANAHRYIIETRKLIETLNTSNKIDVNCETIEICDDGTLKFSHAPDEQEFNRMMNADYFELIKFDPTFAYQVTFEHLLTDGYA